ncbi:MAG: hypothetical protein HZB13_08220 [Acidobacteria bacterium]|nr:hypothetical protein [Acidobacteriota bacterium]
MKETTRRVFLAVGAAAGCAAGQTPGPAPPKPATPSQVRAEQLVAVPAGAIAPAEKGAGRYAAKRWKAVRLVDEDETTGALNDIRLMGMERGIAVGALNRRGKVEPQALLTRDGGVNWTAVKLRDVPLSLQMLDESRGFYVGEGSLWYTDEGGAAWEKRKLPNSREYIMLRVHFVDPKRGWAYGAGKVFWSTEDGGLTWRKVKESEDLNLKAENTIWTSMVWLGEKAAMLAGSSAVPRTEAMARIPDWMLPERAARRRLTPSTTVVGETRDAGLTWKLSVASTFGRVIRMRSYGMRALTVFHYGDGMDFPSEVYDLDLTTGKSKPLFRRKEVVVHDAVPLPGGGAVIAGVEPAGRLRATPVPGKVRIFVTDDGVEWSEMKVDYRAVGRRVTLARFSDMNMLAATDEGTILKLM